MKIVTVLSILIFVSVNLNPTDAVIESIADCSYNTTESKYACELIDIELTDSAVDFTLKTNHPEGYTDDDVEFLYASTGTMTYFPTKFFVIFKNLVKIRFDNVNMSEINEPFYNCDKLTLLTVIRNELTHLKAGILNNCTNLREIDFAVNKIAAVDEETFYGLNEVDVIYLHENKIETLPDKLLFQSPKLRYFRMNVNLLTSISQDFFINNPELYFCPIEDNPTLNGALPSHFFANKNKMWGTWISNLGLREIPKELLANCTQLLSLYCINNRISRLKNGHFDDTINLNTLVLNNNGMEYIEHNAFINLERLERLELENNNLKYIDIRLFKNVPNLKIFKLRNNDLLAISYETFDNLAKLTQVTITCNGDSQDVALINDIKARVDSCFAEIINCEFKFDEFYGYMCEMNDLIIDESNLDRRIVVDNYDSEYAIKHVTANAKTQMKFIPLGIFVAFNDSISMALNNVGLQSVENLRNCDFCMNVEMLDLNDNKLTNFSNEILKFTNLNELSLRNNQILYVDVRLFITIPTLTTIDISLNDIIGILPSRIGEIPYVKDLNLTDNRMVFNDVFSSLHSLNTLNLNNYNGGVQESINRLAFKNITDLKELFIANRKMNSLQNFEFNGILEHLDASDNRIDFIDFNFIYGLQNLKILNLKRNRIVIFNNQTFNTLTLLEILDLSYNGIEDLVEFSFVPLENLLELYLDGNLLTILLENSFVGLNNLRNLTITRNKLKLIENNTFKPLASLKYLNLNENKLKSLSTDHFGSTYEGLESLSANYNDIRAISLDFESIFPAVSLDDNNCTKNHVIDGCSEKLNINCSYTYISDIYECRVINAQIATDEVSRSFVGTHNPRHSADNVLKISAGSDSLFKYMPKEIFETFTKLNSIIFDDVGLDRLDNFFNCSELKEVSLKVNLIRVLSSQTFSSCGNIEVIVLEENFITRFGDDTFANLRRLKSLNFAKNRVNRPLSSDIFNNNEILENLKFNDNKITEIYPKTFDILKNLKVLSFRGNPIEILDEKLINELGKLEDLEMNSLNLNKTIPSYFFANSSNLIKLNVVLNKIEIIHENLLKSLINLEHLEMKSCEIREIQINSFTNLRKMKTIYLQINFIKSIRIDLFQNMNNLIELSLQRNEINNIEDESFKSLRNLEILYLDENQIEELSENLLMNLTSLRTLSLNKNSIGILPENIFINNRKLESLSIDLNEIANLPNHTFVNLQKLTTLSMSSNKINQFGEKTFTNLVNLDFVSLHNNKIDKLHPNTFLNSSKLTSIDISMNFLSLINAEMFRNLKLVKNLYLANNNIRIIETQTFQVLPSLQILNLRNNKIKTLTANMFVNVTDRKFTRIDVSDNEINKISTDFFHHIWIATFDAVNNICLNDTYYNIGNSENTKFEMCEAIIPECKYKKLNDIDGCLIENFNIFDSQKGLAFEVKVDGITAEEVKIINLSPSSSVSFIPSELFDNFTNLEKFIASNVDVKRLEKIQNCKNLKLLNLDNNLNINLGEKVFENCTNLETMSINNVNLSSVNRFTFSGLNKLKILHMNDSIIASLIDFPSSLEILIMSRNKLKIDGRTFANLTNLKELYIDDSSNSEIPRNAFESLKNLEIIDISRRGIEIIPDFPTVNNLQILISNDNNLTSLNARIFDNLKNLTEFHMENNIVSNIDNDAFRGLGTLKVLNLKNVNSKGRISNLNINSFNALVNLEKLFIDNHQIQNIPSNVFGRLKNLKILKLSKNFINDIEKNAFDSLTNLTELDLSDNNNLINLHHIIFINLESIQTLNLKSCQLTSLPSSIITLKSLISLDISSNQLVSLSFSPQYVNLKLIDFRSNKISSINPKFFKSLPENVEIKGNSNPCTESFNDFTQCFANFNKIHYCQVDKSKKCKITELTNNSGNKTTVSFIYNKHKQLNIPVYEIFEVHENLITAEFWNSSINDLCGINSCEKLKIFDLRMNKIESIHKSNFDQCTKIESLILIKNEISTVDEKSFATLKNLKLLDLSFNHIESLSNETFKENLNLDKLFLNSNKFSSIPSGLFANLISLRVLKLSNNSLKLLNNLTMFENMSKLQELHLNQNFIIQMNEKIFNPLVQLRYLNIERNLLSDINLSKFTLNFLTYFDVSSNNISRIRGGFNNFKNLQVFIALDNVCIDKTIENVAQMIDNVIPRNCTLVTKDEL